MCRGKSERKKIRAPCPASPVHRLRRCPAFGLAGCIISYCVVMKSEHLEEKPAISLFSPSLYQTSIHSAALHKTILQICTLNYSKLLLTPLYYIVALPFNTLQQISPHYITVSTLLYTALPQYITLSHLTYARVQFGSQNGSLLSWQPAGGILHCTTLNCTALHCTSLCSILLN